jgi:hypothetical protein
MASCVCTLGNVVNGLFKFIFMFMNTCHVFIIYVYHTLHFIRIHMFLHSVSSLCRVFMTVMLISICFCCVFTVL